MTEKRKQEIISDLMGIYNDYEPTDMFPEINMFTLITYCHFLNFEIPLQEMSQ